MPVPPVINTVPVAHVSGMVKTTLPVWRAWLRYLNAASPRRMSNVVNGNGRSTPASNSSASSHIHWCIRGRPGSNRSKAR